VEKVFLLAKINNNYMIDIPYPPRVYYHYHKLAEKEEKAWNE
jgi:hypothetical protein